MLSDVKLYNPTSPRLLPLSQLLFDFRCVTMVRNTHCYSTDVEYTAAFVVYSVWNFDRHSVDVQLVRYSTASLHYYLRRLLLLLRSILFLFVYCGTANAGVLLHFRRVLFRPSTVWLVSRRRTEQYTTENMTTVIASPTECRVLRLFLVEWTLYGLPSVVVVYSGWPCGQCWVFW